ncbi:MAG: bifunctional folylpolyglutamate synthase/dihydrofolate synthase [Solirubrobacteraceae bacterium]
MTPEQAERYLLSLELFGMRFGLDRMRRLMTALGHPEQRFQSIHVVGTNGKSSTVRMIAAILSRHDLRTGAYLSPHLVSFGERIRIDEGDLDATAFAGAVQRAARAAALVNRSLPGEDCVTQFEALTAAAYSELARRGVEVAVIEAGLGGRYDATNVIPSSVQVLTGVGLEHTRWLGPTIADIAGEKLAVVRDAATLVLGAGMHPDAAAVAKEVAERQRTRIVWADADPGVRVGALGVFQRRNFALARAAAAAFVGGLDARAVAFGGALDARAVAFGGALDARAVADAAASIRVPGRLQIVARDPLTLLDGAHNPAGMAALVESLPELLAGHDRLVAVVSILEDKDAAGMLAALLPCCDAVVFCNSQNPRALPPPTLQSLARQLDDSATEQLDCEIVSDPRAALERARGWAGADGVVLATGSIYLVADLARPLGRARTSIL